VKKGKQKGKHWYILKVEIDAPNTQYPGHLSIARKGFAWAGPLRYEIGSLVWAKKTPD
jgi:hypothetical protein